jgi:hypothetical protein
MEFERWNYSYGVSSDAVDGVIVLKSETQFIKKCLRVVCSTGGEMKKSCEDNIRFGVFPVSISQPKSKENEHDTKNFQEYKDSGVIDSIGRPSSGKDDR